MVQLKQCIKSKVIKNQQMLLMEKEMATNSGILAWKIPWTEEPGGLQSMGCKQ